MFNRVLNTLFQLDSNFSFLETNPFQIQQIISWKVDLWCTLKDLCKILMYKKCHLNTFRSFRTNCDRTQCKILKYTGIYFIYIFQYMRQMRRDTVCSIHFFLIYP